MVERVGDGGGEAADSHHEASFKEAKLCTYSVISFTPTHHRPRP